MNATRSGYLIYICHVSTMYCCNVGAYINQVDFLACILFSICGWSLTHLSRFAVNFIIKRKVLISYISCWNALNKTVYDLLGNYFNVSAAKRLFAVHTSMSRWYNDATTNANIWNQIIFTKSLMRNGQVNINFCNKL